MPVFGVALVRENVKKNMIEVICMRANERKTTEDEKEVSDFVAYKNLPLSLGRYIPTYK